MVLIEAQCCHVQNGYRADVKAVVLSRRKCSGVEVTASDATIRYQRRVRSLEPQRTTCKVKFPASCLQPGVVERFVHGDPLRGVEHQHASHQVLGALGDVGPLPRVHLDRAESFSRELERLEPTSAVASVARSNWHLRPAATKRYLR